MNIISIINCCFTTFLIKFKNNIIGGYYLCFSQSFAPVSELWICSVFLRLVETWYGARGNSYIHRSVRLRIWRGGNRWLDRPSLEISTLFVISIRPGNGPLLPCYHNIKKLLFHMLILSEQKIMLTNTKW